MYMSISDRYSLERDPMSRAFEGFAECACVRIGKPARADFTTTEPSRDSCRACREMKKKSELPVFTATLVP